MVEQFATPITRLNWGVVNMYNALVNFNGNGPATPAAILECETQLKCELPNDYVSFLKRHNGGEGFIGDDSYLILWSVEELETFNREYEVASYCPELLLIGSSGGGEAYGFDKRSKPWRVVQVPFVGMDYSLCEPLGSSFSEFIETLSKKDLNS